MAVGGRCCLRCGKADDFDIRSICYEYEFYDKAGLDEPMYNFASLYISWETAFYFEEAYLLGRFNHGGITVMDVYCFVHECTKGYDEAFV